MMRDVGWFEMRHSVLFSELCWEDHVKRCVYLSTVVAGFNCVARLLTNHTLNLWFMRRRCDVSLLTEGYGRVVN